MATPAAAHKTDINQLLENITSNIDTASACLNLLLAKSSTVDSGFLYFSILPWLIADYGCFPAVSYCLG